jgi:two-component system response regulator HydG
MPDVDGLEMVSLARALIADLPIIVATAPSTIETAIESIRRGAYHYLAKPFRQEELIAFLERAFADKATRRQSETNRGEAPPKASLSGLIGDSPAIQALRQQIERIAAAPVPVIILGETGVGKGLVAQLIHGESGRSSFPFVSINCAAIPESLLESELFGHAKGAFTGAVSDSRGLIVEANRGSLFLDEIGETTPALQAKFLHILERRSVRAVGSTKEQDVDIRILAATHRDLAQHAKDGKFRNDLLYRLDVVSIVVPPLRDHPEDIPQLLSHFLAQARGRYPNSPVRVFSPRALAQLCSYRWPGNIRQLAHTVERIVLWARDAEVDLTDLPEVVRGDADGLPFAFHGRIVPLRELERHYIFWAVTQSGGHRASAAERLGVDPKTLRRWLGVPRDGNDNARRAIDGKRPGKGNRGRRHLAD